ncbi:MAG: efflux RND transporter permease subunit [Acidobacteria bacterium]|nr:efflux RND transporter permease subunit [Acidobacteriota bacterium]
MIKLSLRRPVTVTMVVAMLLVLGVISYTSLGRDLLPEIAYPSLTIMTKYEGAAPLEVEEFITDKLEASLATVKGKRRITSVSREGISLITVEFEWGEDMQIATLNVREKLDNTTYQAGFPQDADRPTILKWDPSAKPIVGLAICANVEVLELKEGIEEIIKPRFEQLDGVALAQISGDIERVIDVEVDADKMNLYGIQLNQVTQAISQANGNIPGGTVKKGRYRYALRTLGEFNSVNEIAQVVVARSDGSAIRVKDIARVVDTTKDRESMATVNGREAVGLLIYKESGANTIETTKSIKSILNDLAKEYPSYQITLAFEEAKFIEQALNNVWLSLIFGGLFAFVVLVLFLGDLKAPVFIFVSIPIAIITTLVSMYLWDKFHTPVSLNIMSLGGLALGVGMLVDNSIVVLENIYRHRDMGLGPKQAAYQGTKEVVGPITASTLTTVAVFFPIVYLKGIAGALFGEQALTVTFSMLASLIVSVTVLPLLTALAEILKGRDSLPAQVKPMAVMDAQEYPRPVWFWSWWEWLIAVLVVCGAAAYFKLEWVDCLKLTLGVTLIPFALKVIKHAATLAFSFLFQLFVFGLVTCVHILHGFLRRVAFPLFNRAFAAFEKVYHSILLWCLDRKLVTVSVLLGVLVVCGLAGRSLKRELMPKSATGQFTIEAKLPPGTALEITAKAIEALEAFLSQDKAVEVVFSQIGASEANLGQLLKDSGTNTAVVSVKLRPEFISLRHVYRIAASVRAFASEMSGLSVSFVESESSFEDLLASEGGTGFQVQIEGEQLEGLYVVNDAVVEALRGIEGLKDVKTSLTRDYPQMQVQLDRDAIERYGFTVSSVGEYLSGGMRGAQATEYKEFDKKFDVRVRFAQGDRENFNRIMSRVVNSPSGSPVPVSELMQVEIVKTSREIRRADQRRVALISAGLEDKRISEVVPAVEAALRNIPLPSGVSKPRIVGEQQGIKASFGQLGAAFLLSALLVYMIMAGQFESLLYPLIVIFTVPMGLIGSVVVLYTFGQSINIMSLIGLIVLTGIVVNDAIVKIDFILEARRAGATVRDAILEASRVRLRPILMTTATTVLGLLPMASGILPWLSQTALVRPIMTFMDWLCFSLGVTPLSTLFSGQGAEIQQPMALVVIGGLTGATLLTLILIPLFFEALSGRERSEVSVNAVEEPV